MDKRWQRLAALLVAAMVWGWTSGARAAQFATVALSGDRAPGTGGAVFTREIDHPVVNGAGKVAFRARLKGTGVTKTNDRGLWAGKPRGLALVAREGDPAPGAGGAVFSEFRDLVLNGAGELAFEAKLTGSGVTSDNNRGIWAGRPSALALVVREGDPAPGAGGAVFDFSSSLPSPVLNGTGELAFRARLMGSGVTPEVNDRGIWVGKPGGLALAARRGDPAPGAGGAVFRFVESYVLNGAGELAFIGFLDPCCAEGIWSGRPGALALVARGGDPAPGAGGAVFGLCCKGVSGELTFFSLTLNGAGEVAFKAHLSGSGVTSDDNDSDNDVGIWAGAPGRLQFIAREGDGIEVAPADFRTVADRGIGSIHKTGNEDGRPSGFSEGGQTAFLARFTDGGSRGVFLSPPKAPKVHLLAHRPVSGAWDQVILPRSFEKPVIVAGPPGIADAAPGVVRLRKTRGAKGRFEARFQEWDYLDGAHPEERTDFLVMNKGRRRQADGSIWEAGTVKLGGNRTWEPKTFQKPFPGVPRVFATVQTVRDAAAVAARVRNVTRTGFEVSIQEQENDLAGGHAEEKVGYLAVYSKRGKGRIAGGVRGTKYRLRQAEVDHLFETVLGREIKLEEEASQDVETTHAKEKVSVMKLGRGRFAQQASDREIDTTAIRRRPVP